MELIDPVDESLPKNTISKDFNIRESVILNFRILDNYQDFLNAKKLLN